MGKIPRKNKRGQFSEKYLEHIKLYDFQGRLSLDEVKIAKANGLLQWDLWQKARKVVSLTTEQHRQGIHTAPILDGYGKPDTERYPADAKFIIKNYEDLEKALKA